MQHRRKELFVTEQARQQLDRRCGPDFWRSLEELAQTPAFQEVLQQHFPPPTSALDNPISRRRFLTLMGASLALAGLSGCAIPPREQIVPYVRQPEEIVPGRPLYFATAMPFAGYGSGLLVESHLGRPTKVEGNPLHPACPLAVDQPPHAAFAPSDVFAQASVLGLYDPDRSEAVVRVGGITTWDAFTAAMETTLRGRSTSGVNENLRLRILTETQTSPSLVYQLQSILARFPQARWHVFEPAATTQGRSGARHAFGAAVLPHYHLDKADVILSLDANFLGCGAWSLHHTRDFTNRRRVRGSLDNITMNRLYVAESMPSITGAMADHRLSLRSGQIAGFARAVAAALEVADLPAEMSPAHEVPPEWVQALADDLRTHRGRCLVIAGEAQPPLVHALAHAMNVHLGNVGRTVTFTEPVEILPEGADSDEPLASLRQLVHDMAHGEVELLLILSGNPVYTAPVDLHFAEALEQVPTRIHLSLYEDETSEHCHWHIPEAHYLESWGDVRAHDGTVTIIQPLIAPLYNGKTASEVLDLFTEGVSNSAHDIVRAYWQQIHERRQPLLHEAISFGGLAETLAADDASFSDWWRKTIHDGVMAGTALPQRPVELQNNWADAPGTPPPAGADAGLEIVFQTDPTVYDGRFANNGWLQELPKPLSKLTWDNAAFMSARTAAALGLADAASPELAQSKVVRLSYRDGAEDMVLEAPVWILPGHADDSVTVHLGYGRTRSGRVGTQQGFNAYKLRLAGSPWFRAGLQAVDVNRRYPLVTTQHHHLMHHRNLIPSGTPEQPPHIEPGDHDPRQTITLYPRQDFYSEGTREHRQHKWGMSIDVTTCTGCSACVVACQSENNIPVVGKEEVSRGREMHWLRIDTYYKGELDAPQHLQTFAQPVPCMHCENAPCELVCPVEATAHSEDGLNDMVYNRCVGTRYCSNNCPYKVRRFNWFQFTDYDTLSLQSMYNPDVTVRSRGVMEKCTYCVQRIREGQIQAELEDRPIRDGEIMTACQSACPAGAIIFGDLNHRSRGNERSTSKVAQLQEEPLNYGLLTEQNTRPRTTYLAAVKNPNPALVRLARRGGDE